ncbi:MAG: hypothetical protein PHI97_02740 [Desulfobulbus sp.]|nr:hypothetical protein [Desulfobulbus sp.]
MTRPSLQRVYQAVAESLLSFSGILASTRDGFPAIASDNRSGFLGNQDQWLFFFAAMLFFVLAGSQHGCSIFGWDSLD